MLLSFYGVTKSGLDFEIAEYLWPTNELVDTWIHLLNIVLQREGVAFHHRLGLPIPGENAMRLSPIFYHIYGAALIWRWVKFSEWSSKPLLNYSVGHCVAWQLMDTNSQLWQLVREYVTTAEVPSAHSVGFAFLHQILRLSISHRTVVCNNNWSNTILFTLPCGNRTVGQIVGSS